MTYSLQTGCPFQGGIASYSNWQPLADSLSEFKYTGEDKNDKAA